MDELEQIFDEHIKPELMRLDGVMRRSLNLSLLIGEFVWIVNLTPMIVEDTFINQGWNMEDTFLLSSEKNANNDKRQKNTMNEILNHQKRKQVMKDIVINHYTKKLQIIMDMPNLKKQIIPQINIFKVTSMNDFIGTVMINKQVRISFDNNNNNNLESCSSPMIIRSKIIDNQVLLFKNLFFYVYSGMLNDQLKKLITLFIIQRFTFEKQKGNNEKEENKMGDNHHSNYHDRKALNRDLHRLFNSDLTREYPGCWIVILFSEFVRYNIFNLMNVSTLVKYYSSDHHHLPSNQPHKTIAAINDNDNDDPDRMAMIVHKLMNYHMDNILKDPHISHFDISHLDSNDQEKKPIVISVIHIHYLWQMMDDLSISAFDSKPGENDATDVYVRLLLHIARQILDNGNP